MTQRNAHQALERVVAFVDHPNTLHALRAVGRQVDLVALRNYLGEGRDIIETLVYLATHPLPEQHEADQILVRNLQMNGFLARTKAGHFLPNGRLKGDLDLEMALDVMEVVAATQPDIVVLVTGDGDFCPVVERLRLKGIRVEVASTPGSMSSDLRAWANGFIDLTQFGQAVDNLPLPEAEPLVARQPQAEPVAEAPEPTL